MLFIFSMPVLIRHLWKLKGVVFLHWCQICANQFCTIVSQGVCHYHSLQPLSKICREARSLLLHQNSVWVFTRVSSSLACKYQTSVVVTDRDQHSSLLQYRNNYRLKIFYSRWPECFIVPLYILPGLGGNLQFGYKYFTTLSCIYTCEISSPKTHATVNVVALTLASLGNVIAIMRLPKLAKPRLFSQSVLVRFRRKLRQCKRFFTKFNFNPTI